jgi:hypothetical protein
MITHPFLGILHSLLLVFYRTFSWHFTQPFFWCFTQPFLGVVHNDFLTYYPTFTPRFPGHITPNLHLDVLGDLPHIYPEISIYLLIVLSIGLSRDLLIDNAIVVENDFIIFTQHFSYGFIVL